VRVILHAIRFLVERSTHNGARNEQRAARSYLPRPVTTHAFMIRRSKETLASPLTQGASMPRIVCSNSQLCVAYLASYRDAELYMAGNTHSHRFVIDCIQESHHSDFVSPATLRASQDKPFIRSNSSKFDHLQLLIAFRARL